MMETKRAIENDGSHQAGVLCRFMSAAAYQAAGCSQEQRVQPHLDHDDGTSPSPVMDAAQKSN